MKCEGGHEMRRRMIVTKCEFSNNDSRWINWDSKAL
jgi:hypothetical protein